MSTATSDEICLEILRKLLHESCQDVFLPVVHEEKRVRAIWGRAENVLPVKGELEQRSIIHVGRGRDLYGQEKNTDSRYFTCSNCGREVAGQRFAAHVARCLQRGKR